MKKNNVINQILASKRLKYGTSAIVIMVLSVVIFVVLNLLVGLVPYQMDLTPEGLYSLSEQTKFLLETIEKDVVIYGLFDETKVEPGNEIRDVMDLLTQYEQNKHITVKYLDPSKNVGFLTEIDPEQLLNIGLRDFLVVSGESKRLIKYYDMFVSIASESTDFGTSDVGSKAETAFTSAVYYVTKETQPKIYSTRGHGEYSFDTGYITIGEFIKTNGFDHDSVDLSISGKVPDDASVILIANPKEDFTDDEIDMLRDFMNKGNSIMITLDSTDTNEKYVNIQSLLKDYNLAFRYDKIKEGDENYHIVGNRYMISPALYTGTLINSPIKDAFSNILADNVRSVEILRKSGTWLETEALLLTSTKALSESVYDENDSQGAVYVGVASTDNKNDSRIIAIGSADYIQDQRLFYYKQYEDSAIRFTLNCLKWLEGDDDEIFIETKNYFANFITVSAGQSKTISILTIYVMPGIILLLGLAVYLRRRNL
ncbi:MAG: GldG family protein [Clostridia bacterium]|nr:GldG family protein [Clostridia bacterium]MBN2883466.1 GldG family protein [Clostridia bacterium]